MAKNVVVDLDFRNGNPGAVQYGNFINYYKFHSIEERIKLLPNMSELIGSDVCYALDLGCNSGDLTVGLHQFLKSNFTQSCYVLGVDIDPVLIERAKENNNDDSIQFLSLDFMNENNRHQIWKYIECNNKRPFNVVFCFSLTMWIHLNHGDEGLELFLNEICKLGKVIVIEPQPWSCYRKAVKRMKTAKADFPLFNKLKIRNNVEEEIERFMSQNCNAVKVYESKRTNWNRKIIIYETNRTDQVVHVSEFS